MPIAALGLILVAAFLHAVYNFLIKSSRDVIAFFWWTVAFGTVGYGCWLLAGPGIFLSRHSIPYFLVGAAAELGYFLTLVRGYAHGDLSVVYPISRGSPPLFLAAWSALFLSERLPPAGYVGIGIAAAGIYLTSLVPAGNGRVRFAGVARSLREPATLWALASGVFISIYSLADKVAVVSTPPLVYNFWVYGGNTVLWGLAVWRPGRTRKNVSQLFASPARIILGALATVGAYAAVLTALTMTSASYVVAGRGLSVVIGALLGTFALAEGFGGLRIAGAALTVVGTALMVLA